MENRDNAPVTEAESSRNHPHDGFNDGSPVIRPWLLILIVFTMMAGLTASAVMNMAEGVASQPDRASCRVCPFAKAAQQLNAGTKAGATCSMKAAPAETSGDAVADYEARLRLSEPVQPDLSTGTHPVVLAVQSDDTPAEATEDLAENKE